ncbi:peptidase domain-containing ABC transporter [Mangrovicella endophytica]|uniref:peptidase domain-containing ABC transporter n=1 Tax=Mangrovicella endophytica TaxID=2066697 RepID=UPI000C9E5D63|nr:ATP-binding cassette domain-containing protein [Mangrovicella endophytica]
MTGSALRAIAPLAVEITGTEAVATGRTPAERPAGAAPAPGGETAWVLQLRASVERLDAVLRRSLGRAEPSGLERLFCTVCVLSGTNFPLRQLIAALPVDTGAFDSHALVGALGRLGIHATPTQGYARFSPDDHPLLFQPRRGEAVILFRAVDTRMLKLMRADGSVEDVASLRALGRGASWSFAPNNEAHPLSLVQRSHTGYRWFRALLTKFSAVGTGLLITSMAIAAVSVMLPLFTIQIYSNVISLGTLGPLPALIIGMVLIVVFEALLLAHRANAVAWIANRLEFLVTSASFERILRLRPSISERAAVSDQAARLRTFENIRDFITGPAFTSLLEAPASLISLVVIGWIGGTLVVVPLLAIATHFGLLVLLRRKAKVMTSIAADESTEMQRITIETFEKRDAIRQAGLQDLWSDRMIRGARRQQKAYISQRLIGAAGEALSSFVLTVSTILLLAAGAKAVWAGEIGTGGLLAITILGQRAMMPSHILCLSVQRVEQFRNSIDQLNALMDVPPERDEQREYTQIKGLGGSVSFINAGFRTADTRIVYVGLELEVDPGAVIAITGANGTGKTTTLKLLQGLSDLAIGTIRIDGIDLRQLPQEELRRRIAYVPQNPKLFPGTLRDNLLFSNPLASDGQIRAVLARTGLTAAIDALPGGLDHRCGNVTDTEFSAEFQFKFAIAQALLIESKLFLVDEIPNALLDGEVGELMINIIQSNRNLYTTFFVSHRSDFLKLADRVVALRYGKVPVVSTAESLLARAS